MKELNIIEASNTPVGTEFKILYQNGNIDNWKCKVTNSGTCNMLSWVYNDISIGGTQDIINAKFIPIQKSVSFDEILKSEGKCKVEFCSYESNYQYFSDLLIDIIDKYGGNGVKKAIKEGKWYKEEN
jgi:hypothetical protein